MELIIKRSPSSQPSTLSFMMQEQIKPANQILSSQKLLVIVCQQEALEENEGAEAERRRLPIPCELLEGFL